MITEPIQHYSVRELKGESIRLHLSRAADHERITGYSEVIRFEEDVFTACEALHGPEVGFEEVEPHGIQNSETLSQAWSLPCSQNTRSRSHSWNAFLLVWTECSETLSPCENRWKHGRGGN